MGNIGMECGSLLWPVLGSYLASLVFLFNPNAIAWAAVSAAFFFNWKSREWVRQPKKRRNVVVRLSILAVCGILYFSLWGSFLYFNAKYTAPDGSVTTFREGVDNFLHSKAWKDMMSTYNQLSEYVEYHGWQHVFAEFIAAMDPYGESRAFQVKQLLDFLSCEINLLFIRKIVNS